MTQRVVFPNAIDYIRLINHNMVDNALGGRTSFALMPSIYQRAYMLTYETGEMTIIENVLAPDEEVTKARERRIKVITSST